MKSVWLSSMLPGPRHSQLFLGLKRKGEREREGGREGRKERGEEKERGREGTGVEGSTSWEEKAWQNIFTSVA